MSFFAFFRRQNFLFLKDQKFKMVDKIKPVNSNTTGTITPMFSSYDWMKPNLKQKAGTARGKWHVRKDWGKLRGVKSLFLSENMLEK